MSTINKLELLSNKQDVIAKSDTPAGNIINTVYDKGSFLEVGKYVKARPSNETAADTESVITGWGCIGLKKAYCFSQDITTLNGSVSEMHCNKILNVLTLASKTGYPVIGFFDSEGQRTSEGVMVLHGYSSVMNMLNNLAGVVPLIAVVKGPCTGNMAIIAQMFDFVIAADGTKFGIAAKNHTKANDMIKNGMAQFVAKDNNDIRKLLEELLAYLPSNNCVVQNMDKTSFFADDVDIAACIPEEDAKQTDMPQIIKKIADDGQYFEYMKEYCDSVICAFAKMNGITTGIIANTSAFKINGIGKMTKFIAFCDSYDIPIITLVDNGGVIAQGNSLTMPQRMAQLVSAYSMATTVKITVIVKKAIGLGYTCMCPKELGADICVALPSAVISLDTISKEDAKLDELKYFESFCSAYQAAKLGLIDDIIMPEKTKDKIVKSMKAMYTKREQKLTKKHINSPL